MKCNARQSRGLALIVWQVKKVVRLYLVAEVVQSPDLAVSLEQCAAAGTVVAVARKPAVAVAVDAVARKKELAAVAGTAGVELAVAVAGAGLCAHNQALR